MTCERRGKNRRHAKRGLSADSPIQDFSIFTPANRGNHRKPTTTLSHAAAVSRSTNGSKRARLQGRQVTESTQAPAMAAALDAEVKREEAQQRNSSQAKKTD